MKKITIAFLILITSCKKTSVEDINQTSTQNANATSITENKHNTSSNRINYTLVPLVNIGNGVYQAVYSINLYSATLKVSNLSYRTLDDYGRPLPVRNGDPFWGNVESLETYSPVDINPIDIGHSNVFSFVTPSISNNSAFNSSGYTSAISLANSNYQSAKAIFNFMLGNWIASYFTGTYALTPIAPIYQNTDIRDYITFSSSSGVTQSYGKLVRINSGSTFALASIDYPLPPPPPLPTVPPIFVQCAYCETHASDPACVLFYSTPASAGCP